MLSENQRLIKRAFDIVLVIVVLPVLLLPLLILFGLVTIITGKNGLFVQRRVGYQGAIFNLYKIRTLKGQDHKDIIDISESETRLGRWLRVNKIDELPQVFNVLIGNMSWVGPRPDIPGYADRLVGEDRIILSVKPGITGPATLKYKNEDTLLLTKENPLKYNDEVIWPDKVAINKLYVQNWSLKKDVFYIIASIFNLKIK